MPLRLTVHSHPGARVERIETRPDGSLDVWVRAAAVEGKANAAIEQAVARLAGVRPRSVRLISGMTSRTKILELDAVALDLAAGTPAARDSAR